MTAQGSVTPPAVGIHEDVHVTGRRILATFVDAFLFGGLYTVMAALFGTITSVAPNHFDATLPAFPTVIYAVIVVLYYVLMEGYLGQTIGKMLFGIRVVREDTGEVPSVTAATIRTALRVIDGLFGYAVAFVTVLISGKRQRLGDVAARTLVVHK